MTIDPKELHLVSKGLLSQWSQPVQGNDKQIRKFDIKFRNMRFTSPAGVCYTEDLITTDSQVFEDTWQSVENRVAPVLAEINYGQPLSGTSIPTLMEFLAVHLIRSFSYWERHRRRLGGWCSFSSLNLDQA